MLASSLLLGWRAFQGHMVESFSGAKESNPVRVGICITGQLCRLELSSKYTNLMSGRALSVFSVLILQRGEDCVFTNARSPAQRIANKIDVEKWLRDRKVSGKVKYFDVGREPHAHIHKRYVYSLDKNGVVDPFKRAVNHWRQWQYMSACWDEFSQMQSMDFYLKLREDSVVLLPIDFSWFGAPVADPHSEGQVYTPECLSWGGVNDKVALVTAGAAEHFFTAPINVYQEHYNDKICKHDSCHYVFNTYNPETFLEQALRYTNVTIKRVTVDQLPIVTGELHGTHFICFQQRYRQLGSLTQCLPASLQQNLFSYLSGKLFGGEDCFHVRIPKQRSVY